MEVPNNGGLREHPMKIGMITRGNHPWLRKPPNVIRTANMVVTGKHGKNHLHWDFTMEHGNLKLIHDVMKCLQTAFFFVRSKEYDMDNHKLTSLSFEGECKASDFLDLLKGSQNTILMIGVPHSIHWLITTISPQNNGCHNSCRLPMCRYTRTKPLKLHTMSSSKTSCAFSTERFTRVTWPHAVCALDAVNQGKKNQTHEYYQLGVSEMGWRIMINGCI